MKRIVFPFCMLITLFSCNTGNESRKTQDNAPASGSVTYAYKATYSSDITPSAHPEYAQRVLNVWKYYERNMVDSMKQFYADTVTYEPVGGTRFHGSVNDLLKYAQMGIADLDSMRFDVTSWQNVHINDKNEDWVYVWARERRYDKNGKADTTLMHEQWKIEHGKITYFNQYCAKQPH